MNEKECYCCIHRHKNFYKEEPCYSCVNPEDSERKDGFELDERATKPKQLQRLLENQ